MDYKEWADKTWDKAVVKLRETAKRNTDKLPFTTGEDGMYEDMNKSNPGWWTNGFWGGLMWLMYQGTKEDIFKTTAENCEAMLDKVLQDYDKLDHDVGFLWHITAGENYRLTGNRASRSKALTAASVLAGRFNDKGRFIRAWNNWGSEDKEDRRGWAIIDCMMNIPLLYWASRETKDERFKYIAMAHADTTMNYHVRPDGSINHIMHYDPENGGVIEVFGGQGYDKDSSWSRGQAWGLYGFTLSYIHTKKQEYLDTAKRIANYFIAAVCDDYLPKSDFRAPAEPVIYDTSAGACAACGLLELADCLGEYEGVMYRRAAIKMLQAMEEKFCDWNPDKDSILQMGNDAYHGQIRQRHLIYADYYFIEALYKIKELGPLFW